MLEKLILGLHELLLAALGNVVVFHGLIALEPAIHAAAELLDRALAERVLGQRKVLSGTPAAAAKLNGCILYNHGFGRCSLSDSCFAKHLREELRKVNLPLLTLDGDCMDPTIDPCSTFTKISAFIEALNSKKYGNIFGPVAK